MQHGVEYYHGEELGPFCWPIPAAGLQFLVHLIDLLRVCLRCNGFHGIKKAVVNQTGGKSPNSDYDLFLMQVWLWKELWNFFLVQLLSWSLPVVIYNPLFVAHHNSTEKWFIVVAYTMRWHFKTMFFFDLQSVPRGTHLSSFFTFQFASNTQWPQNGQHWVLQKLLV